MKYNYEQDVNCSFEGQISQFIKNNVIFKLIGNYSYLKILKLIKMFKKIRRKRGKSYHNLRLLYCNTLSSDTISRSVKNIFI